MDGLEGLGEGFGGGVLGGGPIAGDGEGGGAGGAPVELEEFGGSEFRHVESMWGNRDALFGRRRRNSGVTLQVS